MALPPRACCSLPWSRISADASSDRCSARNCATSWIFPDHYKIIQVIALGKPAETVVIDEVKPGSTEIGDTPVATSGTGATKDGIHHVPKRSLDELIIG